MCLSLQLSKDGEEGDDPIDTVVAFADRAKSQVNTEQELAKLFSYVQTLPDSEPQKQIFMKRVSEAFKFHVYMCVMSYVMSYGLERRAEPRQR